MTDQGYDVKPLSTGSLKITPIPEHEQLKYVSSLSTYYHFWQPEHPKLKVSKPTEDLCNKCTTYTNRHHFLAKHKTMSSDVSNLAKFDDLIRELERDAGVEKVDNDVGEDAEPTQEEPENSETAGDAAGDGAGENGEVEEPDDFFFPVGLESEKKAQETRLLADNMRETLLLECALHIRMAHVQRLLYCTLVAKAREHAQQ
mmetsp:Transcript_27887/g.50844  ORF Transcript_27887/g.50844 Transcript_27887/m.50844 type:complete len:201 (+) Transcript_27887:713-1315(+)